MMYRPTFLANFANTKRSHPFITFTRTTTARFFDSNGLLKTAAINEPRFNHDITTKNSLGLLVEEQRTNLALYSRDMTNAAWFKSNATAALDQIGIDGAANSASKITATSASGACMQAITSASAARSQSAYIKRLTGSGLVYMTMDNGATWVNITNSINANSYARVSIPAQTLANPVIGFMLATSGDAIAVDYVQHELGPQPTSPILTTAASVTRAADVAFINTANLSLFFNALEGTLIADVDYVNLPQAGVANRYAWQLLDSATSNQMANLWKETANAIAATNYFGGIFRHILQGSAISAGKHTSAVAYVSNGLTLSSDNSAAIVGNSALIPAANFLYIGSNQGASEFLNGHIASLAYFPESLSAANLQQLSLNI